MILPTNNLISSNFAKGRQTFLIPLTFPDLRVVGGDLEIIGYGGDVWELRVDLLQEPGAETATPSLAYVKCQLQYLQQNSQLPIIFTIRTASQGGRFPDDAHKAALDLMSMAREQQCHYIDVECDWPRSLIDDMVARKGETKIIASFHEWTGQTSWKDWWLSKQPVLDSYGDILKCSIWIKSIAECHEMALLIRDFTKAENKPLLAVGMGPHGQLSRVLNPITFVTHPRIPTSSAPGQLTLAKLQQCQYLLGQIPKQSFYIFGNNISHSLSPTIHNAAFAELGLPHHYSIHDTPEINDSVVELMKSPNFGGASVTYPHKLQVQPLLQSLSASAQTTGAVNTIVVKSTPAGRQLHGDNTDWLGIRNCIKNSGIELQEDHATVLGSGGAARAACFALQSLGYGRINLINRTTANAERLANDFPAIRFNVYQSLSASPPVNMIVACIPADNQSSSDIPEHIFTAGGGVVIEMAYRPVLTALMEAASKCNGWKVVGGIDVLREQGYAQFQLWTGRRAPVKVIEAAIHDAQADKR